MKAQKIVSITLIIFFAVSVGMGQRGRGAQPLSKDRCSLPTSPLGALLQVEQPKPGDEKKIPLILIHGIHGSDSNQPVFHRMDDLAKEYWAEFIEKFWKQDEALRERYQLYIFNYCSDREPVFPDISSKLGDLIDAKILDRPHVILAHSMGGLVAKAYMVYFQHKSGKWMGIKGGDTVLGAITLATPHHGTHGANGVSALEPNVLFGWNTVIRSLNFTYWSTNTEFFSPQAINSGNPNRSDLRWDNYDGMLTQNSTTNDDINIWLPNANKKFEQFSSKVILYAGIIRKANVASTPLEALAVAAGAPIYNDHLILNFANDVLINSVGGAFGMTDGLVPYKSSLLCDPPPYLISSTTPNFICGSKFRVRRFEAGPYDAQQNERPDANTLSIKRIPRGYDHKDMYEHPDVLRYVAADLKGFVKGVNTEPLPTVPVSKFPTEFLFDVSGSMSDNGKIGQARDAGLDALREMREGAEGTAPPVSIMTFSGDNCGGRVTQKILNFTGNLTEAESTMRSRLPVPNGGTPIPQAKDAAYSDMLAYLNANSGFREGRIVLLSDGQSTCGAIRPPDVYSIRRTDILVSQAVNSRIRFLTIGFDVPPGSEAERDLQYLASVSGGKYYNAADRNQLIRAFQKQVRRFVPRPCSPNNPDFAAGLKAFADTNFPAALQAFRRYSAANPNDWCGAYNLALAYEANDRYKKAAETYQLYLKNAPNSPDRAKIEERIAQLRQDYLDQLDYYANLMQSDIDYLKRYYQSIYNRSSAELAREFSGFVYEKRDFYAQLPEILDIDARWLINDSKDISSSIDVLAKRRDLATFDRDAVSLLTIPIGLIEDTSERLRKYRSSSL
jgi:Mg-chelatase subunit ChlD/triacylglycerol esterase/lipase EstA (alpha/beta hydrolase family)